MSRRVRLKPSHFRVLITDVLPYERPPFFTNQFFSNMMQYYGVRMENGKLIASRHKEDDGLKDFLKLISCNSSPKDLSVFNYKITKDGIASGRTLTLIHPLQQLAMVEFYKKYETLILYYVSNSGFSLRYPYKVAKTVRGEDRTERIISDDADTSNSQVDAKHYFTYRRYSNISDFYNDYLYLRLEKQFNHMMQVDIMKCFDSIDAALLPELIFGFNEDGNRGGFPTQNFASDFAELHLKFKKGEKGIIIGPEFSRIFAEIFLQQIEARVVQRLSKEEGLTHPKDYRMLRYVDDSFIYANSLKDMERIASVYESELKEVGLDLKNDKRIRYEAKPFVNKIAVIKDKIGNVLDEVFENKLKSFKGFLKVQEGVYTTPTKVSFKSFILHLRNQIGIANFPTTDGEERRDSADCTYKDVLSFLFTVINNKLADLLSDFNTHHREYSQGMKLSLLPELGKSIKEQYEREFVEFCIELVESLFFIFNSDPRMTTSINVVQIIDRLQSFVRGKYRFDDNSRSMKFLSSHISEIDEKITDETNQVLRHRVIKDGSGLMEILNLLELQHRMFPRNRINEALLLRFLERVSKADETVFNFLTLSQLIHFTTPKKRYENVTAFAWQRIEPLIKRYEETEGRDTESLLMMIELLADPSLDKFWIDMPEYKKIYRKLSKAMKFIRTKKNMFIVRYNYSVGDCIHQLKSEEVY